MRTIAIGDIHGCSQALASLLEILQPAADDRVVFLGDYVDRGPDSQGVLELILAIQEQCQVVPLLGNHETMLLDCLDKGAPHTFWVSQCGGGETLASYGGELRGIPPRHVTFLRSCRRFYETPSHLFVHANYVHSHPLENQSDEILLWQHLSWSVPRPHHSGKTAIVGHTPQRSGRILNLGHLQCIDTACFAGGWLTALHVETGESWQANNQGETRDGSPPT